MHELFQDIYNPEEGSVSQDALETFEQYKPQLGSAPLKRRQKSPAVVGSGIL
jgi:hypothetical protein